MNYATIKFNDIANGSGIRTSLFVSGCTHRCKGCFHSEAWDFNYGKPFTKEVEDSIIKSLDSDYIDGLSLLGGEPFEPENQKALYPFIKRASIISTGVNTPVSINLQHLLSALVVAPVYIEPEVNFLTSKKKL